MRSRLLTWGKWNCLVRLSNIPGILNLQIPLLDYRRERGCSSFNLEDLDRGNDVFPNLRRDLCPSLLFKTKLVCQKAQGIFTEALVSEKSPASLDRIL